MYNILIVEDDCIQLKSLSDIIKQTNGSYRIYAAADTEEAIELAQQVVIDLFFIDINLKNKSGLQLALEIRKIERYKLTWILFVTIYKEYMLPAFKKVHCYDYILKPYNKEQIQTVTKLLLSGGREETAAVELDEKYIIIPVKNIRVKIFVSEIIFIEVFLRTSIIHTINGSFTIDYLSLKKLNSMIDDEYIIQSHRSYLVNLKYINKIEKTNDKTSNKIHFYKTEKTALMGYSYKKSVMDRFNHSSGGDINEN